MQLKCDTNKTSFFMYYKKFFLKDGPQDNNWVGKLVMKPVDEVAF